MDPSRNPPVATGSPLHPPVPQPRLPSQTLESQTLLPREPAGPCSTKYLKRKEHAEPTGGSEEIKRRKFPPSEMAGQTNRPPTERYDGDDRDERKGENWMQGELSRLRAEVENHKHVKQDMLLDFLQEQERREKAESNLRLEQLRSARNLAVWQKEAWREELRTAKDDLQVQRMKCQYAEARLKEGLQRELAMSQHAQAAADSLNSEIEHLQDVNATMVSDLDELRGIENEAATKRRDEHLGLPPAYGNLDDEGRFPPYSAHEDGGTIEVAHLKREIRQRFELVLNRALNGGVERKSKLELLGTLACGLGKACDNLQKLLDIAPRVPVSCMRKPTNHGGYIESQLRSLVDSVRDEGDPSHFKDVGVIGSERPRTVDRILQAPAPRMGGGRPGESRGRAQNRGPSAGPVLDLNALNAASPRRQKRMLGEALYPKIRAQQPELAGKITGMLLEMENFELLGLIENEDALRAKVDEAMAIYVEYVNSQGSGEPAGGQQPNGAENAAPATHLPGYAIVQKTNSAPYVADRIAKLLLELLWRSAAACEVRPGTGILPPNAARSSELITSIMLHFTQVDSVLTNALQLAFSRGISTSKLQYHLTQLERLKGVFQDELYEEAAHREFFGKATEWLREQVEKVRSLSQIEAFKLRHPEIFGQDGGEDDGDDVSSRWQGSDAGSGEDGSEEG
jgi:hypothetical protein